MKKEVYINSIGSVSVQKTFNNSEFLNEIVDYEGISVKAVDPNYKEYIPPAAARRMAKGIKMSAVSSQNAMKEAGLENVDAIIVGTGLGCLGDSEKFVRDLLDNDEQYLTPTKFIQSSHNTVAGSIALDMGCKGYNFTYVHSNISFESSLWDAKLQLANNEAEKILVGAVDEVVDHHVITHQFIEHIKKEPVSMRDVLNSGTKGIVFGEGSHFFVLSNKKQQSTYSKLLDMGIYNTLSNDEVSETIRHFVEKNGASIKDLDGVILGNNGDVEHDTIYHELGTSLFHEIPQLVYKHLSGEYDTASGFAFWLANKIFKTGKVPETLRWNDLPINNPKRLLIYNQYRGKNHSLVLLEKC
ncbi:beta-ketoacyl synthase N-terminal-like domain-containing protein [Maribacter cobaltidurans]|uniref:3-oxoacyl-ACP synthase n=1 Tax=Maribacter cobaltidurans TaxID=1178778 RepID=A0A223V4A2_9FLAO|nr:beta-ketoacyl synthase N-terminal-like domain-containing protein [Maribacter cobaltidurans]ASV29828.1 3-oxoacyl-ACP synthase [Maribacter cobaltidurans]GGD92142.1 3-oxoacyl-ACP synthase [Maribacter cobaltidurans]